MKTFNASHVKTYFAQVFDVAEETPVRVERRGHLPTIILPESEYQKLKKQFSNIELSRKKNALKRLQKWAETSVEHGDIPEDERAKAIIAKHGKHW